MNDKGMFSAEPSKANDQGSVEERKKPGGGNANQKSLQELATNKALSEILQPSFQDSDFELLEPRLQRLLFSRLRSELLNFQQLPDADASLYAPTARRRFTHTDRIEVGLRKDFTRLEYYKDKWELAPEKYGYWGGIETQTAYDDSTCWDSGDLLYDRELPGSGFMLTGSQQEDEVSSTIKRSGRFSGRISPQLLQYRLTATFGMMPKRGILSNEVYWETYLRHVDDESVLYLCDAHGAPGCKFQGIDESIPDALGLLDFLCGVNIPNSDPHDGFLADTMEYKSEANPSGRDAIGSDTSSMASFDYC